MYTQREAESRNEDTSAFQHWATLLGSHLRQMSDDDVLREIHPDVRHGRL